MFKKSLLLTREFLLDCLGAGGASSWLLSMLILFGVAISPALFMFLPLAIFAGASLLFIAKKIFSKPEENSVFNVLSHPNKLVLQVLGAGGASFWLLGLTLGTISVLAPILPFISLGIAAVALLAFTAKLVNRIRKGNGLKSINTNFDTHHLGIGIFLVGFGAGGALTFTLTTAFTLAGFAIAGPLAIAIIASAATVSLFSSSLFLYRKFRSRKAVIPGATDDDGTERSFQANEGAAQHFKTYESAVPSENPASCGKLDSPRATPSFATDNKKTGETTVSATSKPHSHTPCCS